MKLTLVLVVVALVVVSMTEAQKECKVCSAQYDPQCAKEETTGELKQFENHCKIGHHNCVNNTKFKFFKKGSCEKKGPNPY